MIKRIIFCIFLSRSLFSQEIIEVSVHGILDVDYLKTVTIGTQVWMPENLNEDHYRNGDPIPQVQDPEKWKNITYGAWCYYDNDPEYDKVYGKLYNWYAVNDPRGLGPDCWHVPTDQDWSILTDHLGGETVAGAQLKSCSGWKKNGNGTNTSGFSVLPGGGRDYGGVFYDLDFNAFFWSSTEDDSSDAWGRGLFFDDSNVYRGNLYKQLGFSVRLLRD